MLISRSTGRKIVATTTAAAAFVLLYEVTVMDYRYVASQSEEHGLTAPPAPGARLRFTATAYCKGTTTASGINVRTGIAAADPDLLPVGSIVQIDRLGDRYNGIYTGPSVQGRHVDIYMWSCNEALALGRRNISVTVLRLGWNPRASTPRLIDRLFRQREATQPPPTPLPSRPLGEPVSQLPATQPSTPKDSR
jgi:3D (Asp-Asp-Asp) domain-containing protein